jgi:hypothetical protein
MISQVACARNLKKLGIHGSVMQIRKQSTELTSLGNVFGALLHLKDSSSQVSVREHWLLVPTTPLGGSTGMTARDMRALFHDPAKLIIQLN